MDDSSAIRRVIYSNDDELRFRQLVVNSVMATDIMDKDLKSFETRVGIALQGESAAAVPESIRDTVNRGPLL
jgi:hypothetical protein